MMRAVAAKPARNLNLSPRRSSQATTVDAHLYAA